MNNNGKGSGLALILMLVVALIVAWLFMTQMKGFVFGLFNSATGGVFEEAEDPIEAAKDAVDEYNDKIEQQNEDYNE